VLGRLNGGVEYFVDFKPALGSRGRRGAGHPPFAKSSPSLRLSGDITPSSEVCSKILIFPMLHFCDAATPSRDRT
jgi:hypothetical protein